jgi:5-methylcytosine-specific restriction endonuclease McrA
MEDTKPDLRECRKCLAQLPIDAFRKRTDRGDRRSNCMACEKKQRAENYLENRDKFLERQKQRDNVNKIAVIAYRKARRSGKEWTKEDWIAHRVIDFKRPPTDPNKIAAQVSAWSKANLDKRRAHKQNRRARESGAGGSFTEQEWLVLKHKYNNTCICCGKKEPEIKLQADHVIPVSKGGTSYIDNVQPLCGKCNRIKAGKTIDYRGLHAAAQDTPELPALYPIAA